MSTVMKLSKYRADWIFKTVRQCRVTFCEAIDLHPAHQASTKRRAAGAGPSTDPGAAFPLGHWLDLNSPRGPKLTS